MSVAAEYVETPFPMKHMGKNVHHIRGMFSCIYVRQVCLFYVSMWMVHEPGMWSAKDKKNSIFFFWIQFDMYV